MFVLKGKSRLITDKNIFALCFKEYLKKKRRSKSRYDHRFKPRSGFRIAFPKKDRVYLPWFVSICSVRNAKVRVNLESNATTE